MGLEERLWSIFSNLLIYIYQGGVVMLPLLVVSFFMWALIVERLIFFRRLYRRSFSQDDILSFITSEKQLPGERGGIVGMFLGEFLRNRVGDPDIDVMIVDEVVLSLVHSLDRHLELIAVMAAIAPLFGLLGTTIGMVKTFNVIAIFGTGNARALASGISEALITTQTGLFIAIPGVYMSNFLQQRSRKLKKQLSTVGMFIQRELKGCPLQEATDA